MLEIIRWQEASIRTEAKESKDICHHQNQTLPPKQVLDTPPHSKKQGILEAALAGSPNSAQIAFAQLPS